MGRFADSERHIGVAAALLGELATSHAQSPTNLEALARTWRKRAEIAHRQYKWPDGLTFSKRHAEILEQLRGAIPNHIVDQEAFDRLDTRIAFPRDPALLKQFESQFRNEVRTWSELVAMHPDAAPYWQQRSRALGRLRNVLLAMNNGSEAERIMQQLLVQEEDVVRRFPESYENVVRLAWTRYEYGAHIYGLGRVSDGKLHLAAGIDAMTRLRDLYPANPRFYSHLVEMLVFCPEPGMREPERAILLTRLHLELETGHGPLAHLAFAQVHAGQYREALDTCKKVAGTYPIMAVAQTWAEWHVGNKDEARRKMQQAFQAFDGSETIDVYTYTPQARLMRREISQIMGIEPMVKGKGKE